MESLLAIAASNAVLALGLALIAFVVTRFRVHPQLTHALWLLVLLKLVTPPIVDLPVWSDWFEASRRKVESPAVEAGLEPAPPTVIETPTPDAPLFAEAPLSTESPLPEGTEVSERETPSPEMDLEVVTQAVAASTAKPSARWRIHWKRMLAVPWLVGSVALLGWFVRGYCRVESLLRSSRPAGDDLARRAAALAQQIGLARCPRVEVITASIPPIVWCPGVVPRIVLPASLVDSLDPDEVDAVVAHELSHVRRRDHLIRWIEVLAIVGFWWNPVAWYARRRLHEAEEHCCDAWVVWAMPDHRRSYGKALMKTFEFLNDDRRVAPLAGTAFGGALHPERIEMIVKENISRRMSTGLLIVVLLVSACVLPLRAGPPSAVADPKQEAVNETGESKAPTVSGDAEEPIAAEPITLRNADRVRLLSVMSRPVNRIERGPGANEFMFHLDDGIEIVDDTTLEVVRRVADEFRSGFSYSRDGSKSSWLEGTTVVIREEKTGATARIKAGEEDLGSPVLSPNNEVVVVPEIVVDDTGGEGAGSVYLRVFDAKTGELIRKLTIVEGSYGGLTPVFSPDGKTLAVGNRNYRTNLFDTATWKKLMVLPRNMTHQIAFSPDGKLLAAAYVDGTIAIWDVETGEILRTADSGCSQVQFLAWNPAGDLLATSGPKGTRGHRPMPGKVQLWDPKTLRLVKELVDVKQSGSIRFTRDGKRLVARLKRDNLVDSTSIMVWSTSASPQEAQPEPAEPKQPVAESKPAVRFRPSSILSQPESPQPVHSIARSQGDGLLLSYGMWIGLNGEPRLFGKYRKIPLNAISVTNSEGEAQTDEQILEAPNLL